MANSPDCNCARIACQACWPGDGPWDDETRGRAEKAEAAAKLADAETVVRWLDGLVFLTRHRGRQRPYEAQLAARRLVEDAQRELHATRYEWRAPGTGVSR